MYGVPRYGVLPGYKPQFGTASISSGSLSHVIQRRYISTRAYLYIRRMYCSTRCRWLNRQLGIDVNHYLVAPLVLEYLVGFCTSCEIDWRGLRIWCKRRRGRGIAAVSHLIRHPLYNQPQLGLEDTNLATIKLCMDSGKWPQTFQQGTHPKTMLRHFRPVVFSLRADWSPS